MFTFLQVYLPWIARTFEIGHTVHYPLTDRIQVREHQVITPFVRPPMPF
jgi:hypothetical protein